MSRSGYSDDGDGGWALICYRGAVNAAIKGHRGQMFLIELLAVLDAMPEKVLVAGDLEADGQFCALGVAGKARGCNLASIDTYDHAALSNTFNIAESLAREIMWINDEAVGEYRWDRVGVFGPLQPWEDRHPYVRVSNEDAGVRRWQCVRDWVASHIAAKAPKGEQHG